jgi:hypothetical protein
MDVHPNPKHQVEDTKAGSSSSPDRFCGAVQVQNTWYAIGSIECMEQPHSLSKAHRRYRAHSRDAQAQFFDSAGWGFESLRGCHTGGGAIHRHPLWIAACQLPISQVACSRCRSQNGRAHSYQLSIVRVDPDPAAPGMPGRPCCWELSLRMSVSFMQAPTPCPPNHAYGGDRTTSLG